MTSVLTEDISVWPSGLARATCWLPMLPLAPTTFSTTTGWPRRAESRSATKRAMMSGPVPGVKGTMIFTGWSGQAKAVRMAAGAAIRTETTGSSWRRRMAGIQSVGLPFVDTTNTRFTFYLFVL